MKKNYLNEGMKLLLVGICLVLAAAFSETAVDGLLWSFAGGALAPGIARIIQHFYWSAPKNQVRYQEMKEQYRITEKKERLRSTHYEEVSQTFKEASEAGVEFWEVQMDFRPEGITLYSVTRSADL